MKDFFFCLLCAVFIHISAAQHGEHSQTKLRQELLGTYDTYRLPNVHPNNGTKVELGLTIRSFELDESTLKATINGWIKMTWNDPRLLWTPSDYNQLKNIKLKPKDVWRPDILPYTSAEAFNGVSVYQLTDILIYNNGKVLWVPPLTLNVRCTADSFWWPRDNWECIVKMGPWTQDAFNVKVVYAEWSHDETPRRRIGDWRIAEVESGDDLKFYKCCEEPYSSVSWKITLRREGLLYLPTLGILIIAVVVLTLLVFMLPSRSYAKIYLTTFNLLVLTICSVFIVSKVPVPDYNKIPAVFRLLTALIVVQMIIMVCEVFVLTLMDSNSNECPLAPIIGKVASLKKKKKPEEAESAEGEDKEKGEAESKEKECSRVDVALMIDRVGVTVVFLVLLVCCICLWSF